VDNITLLEFHQMDLSQVGSPVVVYEDERSDIGCHSEYIHCASRISFLNDLSLRAYFAKQSRFVSLGAADEPPAVKNP